MSQAEQASLGVVLATQGAPSRVCLSRIWCRTWGMSAPHEGEQDLRLGTAQQTHPLHPGHTPLFQEVLLRAAAGSSGMPGTCRAGCLV